MAALGFVGLVVLVRLGGLARPSKLVGLMRRASLVKLVGLIRCAKLPKLVGFAGRVEPVGFAWN